MFKVHLLGPYRSASGKCVDEDLIRIGLSRHPRIGPSRVVVGHCRPSDRSVLIFSQFDLPERHKQEVTEWAKSLMEKEYGNDSGRDAKPDA